jgi:hypothetical protein
LLITHNQAQWLLLLQQGFQMLNRVALVITFIMASLAKLLIQDKRLLKLLSLK